MYMNYHISNAHVQHGVPRYGPRHLHALCYEQLPAAYICDRIYKNRPIRLFFPNPVTYTLTKSSNSTHSIHKHTSIWYAKKNLAHSGQTHSLINFITCHNEGYLVGHALLSSKWSSPQSEHAAVLHVHKNL